MSGLYAKDTEVSVAKSRVEIETVLTRYGATAFGYGWEGNRAVIQFEAQSRRIRFDLPLPPKDGFLKDGRGKPRTPDAVASAWDKACRRAWRALSLVIKAKLEAVASGITLFEDEFLANIVLPNGSTVGQWTRPQVAIAYKEGVMPKMLPDQRGTR